MGIGAVFWLTIETNQDMDISVVSAANVRETPVLLFCKAERNLFDNAERRERSLSVIVIGTE